MEQLSERIGIAAAIAATVVFCGSFLFAACSVFIAFGCWTLRLAGLIG